MRSLQRFHGLEFHDHAPSNNKIESMQSHGSISVFDDTRFFALEGYALGRQFQAHGVSICGFEEPGTESSMHGESAFYCFGHVTLGFVVQG